MTACAYYIQRLVNPVYSGKQSGAPQLLRGALSVMALERAAMVAQFDAAKLEDPEILEFMKRIKVAVDPAFDAMGNAYRYSTRVTVVSTKGGRHVRETPYRPGSPESPLSDAQLESKFDSLVAGILDARACGRVKDKVRGLESLPALEALIADLRAG